MSDTPTGGDPSQSADPPPPPPPPAPRPPSSLPPAYPAPQGPPVPPPAAPSSASAELPPAYPGTPGYQQPQPPPGYGPPAGYSQPYPPAQAYGQPAPYDYTPQAKLDSLAAGALALSVLGVPFIFCFCLGLPMSIAGVIMGFFSRKRINDANGLLTGSGLALGAIIVGAIGIGLFALLSLLIFADSGFQGY